MDIVYMDTFLVVAALDAVSFDDTCISHFFLCCT